MWWWLFGTALRTRRPPGSTSYSLFSLPRWETERREWLHGSERADVVDVTPGVEYRAELVDFEPAPCMAPGVEYAPATADVDFGQFELFFSQDLAAIKGENVGLLTELGASDCP